MPETSQDLKITSTLVSLYSMKVVITLTLLIAVVPVTQGANLGESCTQDSDCSGTVANSACQPPAAGGTCYCAASFYDDNGATAAGACTAALTLNADCSGVTDSTIADKACSKENAYSTCVTASGASTCTCSVAGTYDTTAGAGGACAVAVGSACTTNAECTARLSNTQCEEFVCACTSGSGLDCTTSSTANKAVVPIWTLALLCLFAVLQTLF